VEVRRLRGHALTTFGDLVDLRDADGAQEHSGLRFAALHARDDVIDAVLEGQLVRGQSRQRLVEAAGVEVTYALHRIGAGYEEVRAVG
jgi:hypothetical protein